MNRRSTAMNRRATRNGSLAIALALALALFAVPTTSAAGTYRLSVSTNGDFVAQTNFVQCVGASMQMMLNMIRPEDDRTAATQLELQQIARTLSPTRPDRRERQGASVTGWNAGLNQLGAGPYRLVGTTTIEEALHRAAHAIRLTGKPVGLLVWRGRHAWVLSGFEATADPATTSAYTVTGAVVLDPLYPHGSSVWGPSPRPGELLSVAELGRQFVPRRTGSSANRWLAGFGGKYVIVMPYLPAKASGRALLLPA